MITTDELPYEQMNAMARTHTCRCGGLLTVAWGGSYGVQSYILRCANDPTHKDFRRLYQPTNYEIYDKKERDSMTNQQLTTYRERTLTFRQNKAREIIDSLWPGAPAIEKTKAIMLCVDYGANPLLKHIFLIPYNKKDKAGKTIDTTWELVFGIKFKRLQAYKRSPFSYIDNTPRLMTEKEEERAYGNVDHDYFSAITILEDSQGNRFPGYGRWNKTKSGWLDGKPATVPNEPKGTDKGNSMMNMALIRSESQALERLAPGALPDDIGVVDAQFEEVPQPKTPIQPEDLHNREEETSGPEINPSGQTESDKLFDQLESASKKTPETKVDEQWVISTINALRKKGIAEVSGKALTDRFNEKYQVKDIPASASMRDVLPKLSLEQIEDFCKWLSDLEAKS